MVVLDLHWWLGALGALGKDQPGEKEAAAKEVDCESMEDSVGRLARFIG
jgi:hypothetical protein